MTTSSAEVFAEASAGGGEIARELANNPAASRTLQPVVTRPLRFRRRATVPNAPIGLPQSRPYRTE